MKKTITLLALCLIGTLSFAQQAPAIQWQNCLGGTYYDQAQSIQSTLDGGYIMAGSAASTNGDVTGNHGSNGSADAWVMKLSSSGNLQWQKCLGGTNGEVAHSIQPTPDGGYIMAGQTTSNDGDVIGYHGNFDAWVVKLSSTGSLQWQKALGGTGYDYAQSIQPTPDGGYIMAGVNNSTNGDVTGNHNSGDAWVVKLNNTGSIQWQKSLGGTGVDEANNIQPTPDGGYIMAGRTYSNDGDVSGKHGGYDVWIVKLSSMGSLQWQKCLGGTVDDQAKTMQSTPDGGYIMAGTTNSNDGDVTGNHSANSDAWVVKLSSTGSLQWQKCLGGTNNEEANCIQSTPDGGYTLVGFTLSIDGDVSLNHGGFDAWVVKLSSTGSMQWQNAIGGTGSDYAYSIQPTIDGGYIVAGSASSTNGDVTGNHGNADAWVVKLGPELSTSGFVKEAIVVYPNPAKTLLTVQNNHQTPFEKIVITDLMGKIVLTQTTNTNQINVDPLASGMYLLEATSGEEHLVSKFVKE
jgi:hypothetical protein